jgi:CheY-like chemotaxis protein
MPEDAKPLVLAFCRDLIFVSKIEGAARARGAGIAFARAGDDPGARVACEAPALVLVDLALKGVDVDAIIRAVRAATRAPIVAFGSHVDAAALERARAAGATQALPRSAFTKTLPDLLAGLGGRE